MTGFYYVCNQSLEHWEFLLHYIRVI